MSPLPREISPRCSFLVADQAEMSSEVQPPILDTQSTQKHQRSCFILVDFIKKKSFNAHLLSRHSLFKPEHLHLHKNPSFKLSRHPTHQNYATGREDELTVFYISRSLINISYLSIRPTKLHLKCPTKRKKKNFIDCQHKI